MEEDVIADEESAAARTWREDEDGAIWEDEQMI
jgi:hypothetical protein